MGHVDAARSGRSNTPSRAARLVNPSLGTYLFRALTVASLAKITSGNTSLGFGDFFEPSSLPAFFATALLVCAGRLLACRRSLAETLLASLGSLLARSSFPASLATRRLVFACIIEPVVAADFRAAIPKPL